MTSNPSQKTIRVLIVDDHPSIRRGLKPGGRFVVVDYFKRSGAMIGGANALEHIRLDKDDVVKEVEAAGFQLVESIEHVPGKQYIAIFTARR